MRKDGVRKLDHATLEVLRERAVRPMREGESSKSIMPITGAAAGTQDARLYEVTMLLPYLH